MALSFNNKLTNKPQINEIGVQNTISTPSVSVSDMIREEDITSQQDNKNKLSDYFKNRSTIRKAISNGSFSSGNQAQDVFESRIGKLVDLYLDQSSKAVDENGMPMFSSEKIIEASKNPSKVINDMKRYYSSDKIWAIDDYIQKGGMASSVFDYLEDVSGNIKNPYGARAEVVGNMFDENTPELAKIPATAGNFLPSLGANAVGRIMSNDWLQDKSYDLQHKIRDDATEEEYNLYKSGKLPEGNKVNNVNIFGESRAKLYDDYTQAKKDGFIGTLDEYRGFKKNVGDAVLDEQLERLKEGILTEDDIDSSKTAITTDALSEALTYFFLPIAKEFKIKDVSPLMNEGINILKNSLINTAELAGMEALKNEPMSEGEIGVSELVNLFMEGIFRTPRLTALVKNTQAAKKQKSLSNFFVKIKDDVEDAFSRLSGEKIKAIKEWAGNFAKKSSYAAKTEGYRNLGKEGVKGVQESLKAYLKAGEELGKEAKFLKGSNISTNTFQDSMNNSLKKLESVDMGGVKWGEGQAPQIQIIETSAGPEIHITNKENLNMIKNGKNEGFGDVMEDIFYGMFGKGNERAGAGMELNEASLLAFSNQVKGATQGSQRSWGDEGAKFFVDGIDAFRNEAKLPKSYLDAESNYKEAKDLYKGLSEGLGVDGKEFTSAAAKAEAEYQAGRKMGDEKLANWLDAAQKKGYISDTTDAENLVFAYFLAQENEAAARAYLEGAYPSKPGMIEVLLNYTRGKMKDARIEQYINNSLQGAGSMVDVPNINSAWQQMARSAGYVGSSASRLGDYESKDTGSNIDVDEAEYIEWLKSKKVK